MKSLFAFVKKEMLEQIRSYKLLITLVIFLLVGIMNPVIAKLTPWFYDMFSDVLAESGMIISDVTVSAMDSWMQFFKNLPIVLIAFVLLQGTILTREFRSGTLILSLTKGFARFKVVVSKASVLTVIWSTAYWFCFGITYFCNSYLWDSGVAQNIAFSALCWWLFGVFVVSLVIFFSILFASYPGVLIGTGATLLFLYMIGLIPQVGRYLPTLLMDGNSLIYSLSDVNEYIASVIVTVILTIISLIVTIPVFNKKQL